MNAGRPPQAPPPTPGARVLVIEDYADLREITCRILTLKGYRVESAADGLAGLELFRAGHFDAVVCDLGLPRLGGSELVRQLRALGPRTALVAVTGLLSNGLAQEALAAGCDEVLVKPLPSLRVLVEVLERTMARKRPGSN